MVSIQLTTYDARNCPGPEAQSLQNWGLMYPRANQSPQQISLNIKIRSAQVMMPSQ